MDTKLATAIDSHLDMAQRAEDLAKAQWTLLEDLERRYTGRKVKNLNSKFEDAQWLSILDSRNEIVINWPNYFDAECAAFEIYCRVVFFELAANRSLAFNTLKGYFFAFIGTIGEIIKSNRLLAGRRGANYLGLSQLTDEDILVAVDAVVARSRSLDSLLNTLLKLSGFYEAGRHVAKQIPDFEIRGQLPWIKAGIKMEAWVKQRASDLGEVLNGVQGYKAIAAETSQPLIEWSLHLVLELGKHLEGMAPLVNSFAQDKPYKGPRANDLLKKYGPIFSPIGPLPDLERYQGSGGSRHWQRRLAVFRWLRKLLYLARGACVNVILFTTGLRNIDVCRLKVDCCKPSGRIDMLYYLEAVIRKTSNSILLPVPLQTLKAIQLLTAIKFTDNDFLIDGEQFASGKYNKHISDDGKRLLENRMNLLLRNFARHFDIAFVDPDNDEEYSAHNYRSTVAGWLDAHSNLSVLLVRRLFAHSNDLMPSVYLRNNPTYIAERIAQNNQIAKHKAQMMAFAASEGRLAGIKGEQLVRGFQSHVRRLQQDPKRSHSLTDTELVSTFSELIENRIRNGSMCGFLTTFGVLCARNPFDSAQPPCAKHSHRDKMADIADEVLAHINDVDPANCVGTSCDQAMVGPWSKTLRDSVIWYAKLFQGQVGQEISNNDLKEHARSFIKQYAGAMRKVFRIDVSPDGTVTENVDPKRKVIPIHIAQVSNVRHKDDFT